MKCKRYVVTLLSAIFVFHTGSSQGPLAAKIIEEGIECFFGKTAAREATERLLTEEMEKATYHSNDNWLHEMNAGTKTFRNGANGTLTNGAVPVTVPKTPVPYNMAHPPKITSLTPQDEGALEMFRLYKIKTGVFFDPPSVYSGPPADVEGSASTIFLTRPEREFLQAYRWDPDRENFVDNYFPRYCEKDRKFLKFYFQADNKHLEVMISSEKPGTPPATVISNRQLITNALTQEKIKLLHGSSMTPAEANAAGTRVYMETSSGENDLTATRFHIAFLKGTVKMMENKYKKPLNLFYVKDYYLHMVAINGDRINSVCVNTKSKNAVKYISSVLGLSDDQALTFIVSDDKRVSGEITSGLEKKGLDYYIRNPRFKTGLSLVEKADRIEKLKTRGLDPASISFVNGLPPDDQTGWKQGFAKKEMESVNELNGLTNTWFESVNQKINSKAGFIQELQTGTNDVIVAFAHATEKAIYINGEKITLEEFELLKKRNIAANQPRVIILLACNTGNVYAQTGLFFKRDVKSMAQIFVEKGFADYVIAPSEEISNDDIKNLIPDLLAGGHFDDINKRGNTKFRKISIRSGKHGVITDIYCSNENLTQIKEKNT